MNHGRSVLYIKKKNICTVISFQLLDVYHSPILDPLGNNQRNQILNPETKCDPDPVVQIESGSGSGYDQINRIRKLVDI